MYHLRMSEYRSMTQLAHIRSPRSLSFQLPDCTRLNSQQPRENTQNTKKTNLKANELAVYNTEPRQKPTAKPIGPSSSVGIYAE